MIRTVDITGDEEVELGRLDYPLGEFVRGMKCVGWETEQAADQAPYWFILTKGGVRVRVEKV